MLASEDSLNRFRRPVAFSASIVIWVYAPAPETSPPSPSSSAPRWFDWPQKTGFLWNRLSGAT